MPKIRVFIGISRQMEENFITFIAMPLCHLLRQRTPGDLCCDSHIPQEPDDYKSLALLLRAGCKCLPPPSSLPVQRTAYSCAVWFVQAPEGRHFILHKMLCEWSTLDYELIRYFNLHILETIIVPKWSRKCALVMRRTEKREIFEIRHYILGKIRNKNLKIIFLFFSVLHMHYGGTKMNGTVPVLRE